MKKIKIVVMCCILALATPLFNPIAAHAEWKQDDTGWWYNEGDSWVSNEWKLVDGNWYYFDADGYMAHNTTINGYYVDDSGKWVSSSSTDTNSVANNLSGDDLDKQGMISFRSGDYKTALTYFEQAAEKGNAGGAEMIGDFYQTGKAVDIDYAKAAEWDQKAIDLGSSRAYTNLGLLYERGLGVTQDYSKALELFEKAKDAGDFKGPRYAGEIYQNGYGNVTVDYAKAAEYYKIAADKGDITASYDLGQMYEKGLGFNKDYSQAITWYENAIKTNDHVAIPAMVYLGNLYENGLGTEKNIDKAIELYKEAVSFNESSDASTAAKEALTRLNVN